MALSNTGKLTGCDSEDTAVLTKKINHVKLLSAFHGGVASDHRGKSTYWSKGLACIKLRDSCIDELYVRSVYFRRLPRYSENCTWFF